MARVKRGNVRIAKRKKVLKQAKGFSGGRKNIYREAKQATLKAGQRAYDHRKLKKRQFRRLWSIKINAGARANGTTYSRLIGALAKKNVALDRKTLANLAEHYPAMFTKVVESVQE